MEALLRTSHATTGTHNNWHGSKRQDTGLTVEKNPQDELLSSNLKTAYKAIRQIGSLGVSVQSLSDQDPNRQQYKEFQSPGVNAAVKGS